MEDKAATSRSRCERRNFCGKKRDHAEEVFESESDAPCTYTAATRICGARRLAESARKCRRLLSCMPSLCIFLLTSVYSFNSDDEAPVEAVGELRVLDGTSPEDVVSKTLLRCGDVRRFSSATHPLIGLHAKKPKIPFDGIRWLRRGRSSWERGRPWRVRRATFSISFYLFFCHASRQAPFVPGLLFSAMAESGVFRFKAKTFVDDGR